MKTTIALFLFVLMLSCENNQKFTEKSCCSGKIKEVSHNDIPGESIYNLNSTWTTQKNESLQLKQFSGDIIICAMVFTHCESACPRIVADMQRIESKLKEKEIEQVKFLLVSMDPERDTPTRLKEFAEEHKLNEHWTLICASQDATIEIANVLGVRVKKLENGGFDHSNIIHVFNQEGLIIQQQNGFDTDLDDTIEAIRSLVKQALNAD